MREEVAAEAKELKWLPIKAHQLLIISVKRGSSGIVTRISIEPFKYHFVPYHNYLSLFIRPSTSGGRRRCSSSLAANILFYSRNDATFHYVEHILCFSFHCTSTRKSMPPLECNFSTVSRHGSSWLPEGNYSHPRPTVRADPSTSSVQFSCTTS